MFLCNVTNSGLTIYRGREKREGRESQASSVAL